ncbi:MAG TPA: DNA-binding protein, partial [Burkholderiaceae bacterium]|nr:DNA-binding protein [Burkholderiaceae bacterium]HNG82495.1 DNA-binding protein [Burkholderiaceae bacterium]
MGRGITEQDVWKAADALLIEGSRPTIERVRLKIGRGSPNTVSPHLETWFARLGARIADPQAFRAPEPLAPEPVRELAQQLWSTAQSIAHQAVESRALEAEAHADAALAERDALAAQRSRLQAQVQAQAAELDALRLALAAAQAQLAERESAQARELAAAQLEREQLRDQA